MARTLDRSGPLPVTRLTASTKEWRNRSGRLSALWTEWKNCRNLAGRLLVRNLRAQYRQTFLGYAWAIVPPLATTLLWVFLQSRSIVAFEGGGGIPYPVYVLTGLLLWQSFLDAVSAPLKNVSEAKPMLAKVQFPREALILAGIGEVCVHSTVRLLLWGGALTYFGFLPAATWPLAILGFVAMMVLATAIGIALTPLGLLTQDVSRGIAVGGQFWLYLTPIVYAPIEGSVLNWVNPVSPLMITTRHWLLGGGDPNYLAFSVIAGLSAVVLLAAILLYRMSMPIVIERMSA